MPLDHVCGVYDISLCRGKRYQQIIIPHPEESATSKSLYLIHLQLAGVMGFGLHNKTKQKSLPPVCHRAFTILG